MIRYLFLCISLLLLASCASEKKPGADGYPNGWRHIDVSHIPNAVPKNEPRSKYGNPDSYVVFGKRYHVMKNNNGYEAKGIASWYGTGFHNKRTSSGQPYDMLAMTAAHKTLPIPSYVKVTNLNNGRWVVVKVNDRGPFHENRIIDLSFAAAKKLGMAGKGQALVDVQAVKPNQPHKLLGPDKAVLDNTHNRLFLQLGAYSTLQAARRLKERVQNLTQDIIKIIATSGKAKPLYKVHIGPIASVDQLDYLSKKFQKAGFEHPLTVVK